MSSNRLMIVVLILLLVMAAVACAAYEAGKNAGQTEALSPRNRMSQERVKSAAASSTSIEAPQHGLAVADDGEQRGNLRSFAGGQVKAINGNTIELSMGTEALSVIIDDQTQIQKTVNGTLADIQPGDRVVIQGERAADGSFTARTVQIGQTVFQNPPPRGGQ